MLTRELVARLAAVKVADLADGCRILGVRGPVANTSLRPGVPYLGLVGTAVTVRNWIGQGVRDYEAQAGDLYAKGQSVPFAVVVQRNDVPDFSSIGSGGAQVAEDNGFVGWVTSGPLRDTDELRELDFPVYGTSVRPSGRIVTDTPPGQSIHFEFDVPVEIAGMPVSPGDILVGDNDGMICLAPSNVEAVLGEAEKILFAEQAYFKELAAKRAASGRAGSQQVPRKRPAGFPTNT